MEELTRIQPTPEKISGAVNTKKLMKELLNNFKFSLPQKGAVLDGQVISVSLSNILIDLGALGTGIIYPKEFYDDSERQKKVKPGQKVKTVLLELENEEGFRELSLKKAQMQTAWQTVKELHDKGEIITVTITNLNKGGLIAEVSGIPAFMPLSQLAEEHYPKVENGNIQEIVKILQTYRNQEFKVKIIDFDELQNKLIISEKAAFQKAEKEKIPQYEVGQTVKGKITEVTDFGAFMKLAEGGDALIPKAEIDWKKIDDPKEVLKTGEDITAKIIQANQNRITLSLKALRPNPWEQFKEKYQVGQKVIGKVMKIENQGVSVEVEEGLVGFIPVQEFAGKKPEEVLELEKGYTLAIIEFDPEKQSLILTPEISLE